MSDNHLNLKKLAEKGLPLWSGLRRYSVLLFLVFVIFLYGFVLLRIDNLINAQPSTDEVNSHVRAAHVPHIDQAVVQQLKSLQDNSVSVKSLFNQARDNPFQ